MRKYVDFVEGTDSKAVAGAFVRVLNYPSGTDATLYADSDGIVQIANPVRTDNTGEFSFYAADGHYTLEVTGTSLSPQTVTDIVIIDQLAVLSSTQAAQSAATTAASGAATSASASATSAANSLQSANNSAGSAVNSASSAASAAAIAAALPTNLGRIFATYAELAAVSGLSTGTPGEVTTDTGTHTDPVVGGTVSNSGRFQYVSATGWKRVGDNDVTTLKTAATALYDEVASTAIAGVDVEYASADGELLLGWDTTNEVGVGRYIENLGIRSWEPWRDNLLRLSTAPTVYKAGEGWNHVIIFGQSNAVGSADGDPVISSTQPYSNLTFNGGVRADGSGSFPWSATKALIEEVPAGSASSETPAAGATEYAVNYAARKHGIATSSMVMFGSVAAQGATSLAGLDKPSTVYTRMVDQVANAKALATAAGKSYNCQAVCMCQGETDITPTPTARTTYVTQLNQFVSDFNTDIKANKTPQDPVHLLVSHLSYGATSTLANNIALAQMDVIQSNPLVHLSHPTYFLPHDDDDTHRSVIGHKWEGAYFGRALSQLLIEQRKPDCLMPLGGFAFGTELRIRFRVPNYPLRLEIGGGPFGGWQKVTDYGIKVVDDTGTLTLSNIHVENGDEVVLTMHRALGANPRLRLGLDYLAWNLSSSASGIFQGAMTNIRDSSKETFAVTYQGASYTLPMYHWSPHYEGAVSVLVS